MMNNLQRRVVFETVGIAASDEGFALTRHCKHLGAAQMTAGQHGISTKWRNDIRGDETPDFIEFDVENCSFWSGPQERMKPWMRQEAAK